MNDAKKAILDAAEKRIQAGGFGGFSFRDIATDVGIKSSSVHYHFPTKEDLAAAVVRRWSECTSEAIDHAMQKEADPVRAWTKAFRGTAYSNAHMCPCTVLGAAARELPEQVANEVKLFFTMCQGKLVSQGLSPRRANEFLSTITGALVVANALRDPTQYDRATSNLQASDFGGKSRYVAAKPARTATKRTRASR
jgi:TetR/AcrR family transcriptional repressor of nem operon